MSKSTSGRPRKALNWLSHTEEMGRTFSRDRLHPEVMHWIENDSEDRPWSIACSGGADSVCLVLMLYTHFPQRRDSMRIFHFNHRLRSEASDSDASFVKNLAEGLAIPFHTGMMAMTDRNKVNEAQARKARFNFFAEEMKKIDGKALFLGQIKEDIGETMLMRLARGSGTKGLAAPRPVHYHKNEIVHLRPLLSMAKTEIKVWMEEKGIPWCDDESNLEDQYLRNRLRHSVLPAWREAEERNVDDGVARARHFLEEDDQALDFWLDELGINPLLGVSYDFSHLMNKPTALIRRTLYRWLDAQSLIAPLSREAIENLLNSIVNRQTLRMSAGKKDFIDFKDGCLKLIAEGKGPDWPPLFAPVDADIFLPHGTRLIVEAIEVDDKLRDSIMKGAYNECNYAFIRRSDKKLASGFGIRQWRPGDRYRPLGAPGTSKLQDLFTDRKISIEERKRLPVVCNDRDNILWIPGLPPAESHKIDKFTNYALRLTYASS